MNIAFAPTARSSVTLSPVRAGLWRVAGVQGGVQGTVLGHVERVADDAGDRYEARRLRQPGGSLTIDTTRLGTFWRLEDAVDCFRFN